MTNYQFIARLWRDSNGNTYHTVAVHVENVFVDTGKAYGYGNHYIQTGFEILQKFGMVDSSITCFDWKRSLNDTQLLAESVYVENESDLYPILDPRNEVYNYQTQQWVHVDNPKVCRVDMHGNEVIDG